MLNSISNIYELTFCKAVYKVFVCQSYFSSLWLSRPDFNHLVLTSIYETNDNSHVTRAGWSKHSNTSIYEKEVLKNTQV